MTNFVVGAQMYSMRDRTQNAQDLNQALKDIKAAGYNAVQLSGQSRDIPDEQVRDMLLENDLVCGATHLSFQEMEEDIEGVIRRHKLWNCAYPGVGSLPGEYRTSKEGFEIFVRKANVIAEKLYDNGQHFIYHNHAFEFARFDGVPALQIMLDAACDKLQFEIDTYWIQAGGANPVEWIRKVAGRMDVVHFKDMVGCPTMTTMSPVGEGNLNWPEILKACDEIGVKFAFVEQDNAVETNSLLCMQTSHDNLVKYGAKF